jgi:hypothetical protein
MRNETNNSQDLTLIVITLGILLRVSIDETPDPY